MAVISFSDKPEQRWVVAGWAFRNLLDDVISLSHDDLEMRTALANSQDWGWLHVHSLEPKLAVRTIAAIEHVVNGILSGTIRSGILDQPYCVGNTAEEYQKGLRDLLKAIPKR